jgi:NOL1/NOP2/fmu family ribosome biogenesis protein
VIHPGWWLGSFQKNRFEPSHALALGLQGDQAIRVEAFPAEALEIRKYLHGESITAPGDNGYTLIALEIPGETWPSPLGWGKRSAGLIKNNYPRGLRVLS